MDGGPQEIPSQKAFLGALVPAAVTCVICLTGFLLLRPFFPDVFDAKKERMRMGGSKKQMAEKTPSELPKDIYSWFTLLASFTDEDIIAYCGADALMYLRFLRMCFKVCLVMLVYGLVVLLPLNIQGKNHLTEFEAFSASNVGDKSPSLWAHFAGAYLLTAVLCFLLYEESNKYLELRQAYMSSPSIQSYSVVIRDLKKGGVDRETLEKYLETLVGKDPVTIHMVEDAGPYEKLIEEKDAALLGLDRANQTLAKDPSAPRPQHKTGFLGLWGETVDSIDYYTKEAEGANEKIIKMKEEETGTTNAAILTFGTIRAATLFKNAPLKTHTNYMSVKAAPARNDILWANLGIPVEQRFVRTLIVIGVVFFLIFCYTIPVSFVSSLANLNALAKTKGLEWLHPVADFSPALTAFLQGFIPPLVLSIFFALVPTFMVMLSRAQGLISESEAQTSAIWKMFFFILFDSFLVVTFAGAVLSKLNQLTELASHPTDLITLLAQSLPAQSTFFMNLIMLAGLSGLSMECLRAVPLLLTYLKRRFLAKSNWDHLAILTSDISFHELYAFPLLVFLPFVAFANIAPLILIFVAEYYGLGYCVWLNQLLYVYNTPYHTGASQFPVVFRCCIASLVVAQLLLTGVMGLKQMAVPSALMIPLIVVTIYFSETSFKRFNHVGNFLSLESLLATDTQVQEFDSPTKTALQNAYHVYQDDGSSMDLSRQAKQPLIEPYAVTNDGSIKDLLGDEEMDLESGGAGSAAGTHAMRLSEEEVATMKTEVLKRTTDPVDPVDVQQEKTADGSSQATSITSVQ